MQDAEEEVERNREQFEADKKAFESSTFRPRKPVKGSADLEEEEEGTEEGKDNKAGTLTLTLVTLSLSPSLSLSLSLSLSPSLTLTLTLIPAVMTQKKKQKSQKIRTRRGRRRE